MAVLLLLRSCGWGCVEKRQMLCCLLQLFTPYGLRLLQVASEVLGRLLRGPPHEPFEAARRGCLQAIAAALRIVGLGQQRHPEIHASMAVA